MLVDGRVTDPVRPPPLRTDGSNEFARYSMQVRVPRIARDTAERADLPPRCREAVVQLARDIEEDRPIPAPQPPAPDVEAWDSAQAGHPGARWLHGEWFFAELAFYREVARATRFWETGRDPFEWAKEEELAGERPWERLEGALERGAGRPRDERVMHLLDEVLWANRVDLSYSVAASLGRPGGDDDDLLVDERAAALPRLLVPGAHVHVVADNTGTELALDLALIDALLEAPGARVTVHLKTQPVFVSDATVHDVWRLLGSMQGRGGQAGAVAERLHAAFDEERLALWPDPYWSGPRFLGQAPPHVARALAGASIAVLKGDANYRRLVGDATWPPATPFAVAASTVPFPLLCLRTMKSDSVLGLPAGLAEALDGRDPRWRVDGRRGLAQAHLPGKGLARP